MSQIYHDGSSPQLFAALHNIIAALHNARGSTEICVDWRALVTHAQPALQREPDEPQMSALGH
jgi:hypothetical protein